MAWTESGLYYATFRDMISNVIAGDWKLTTSKIALYNNTDTPTFQADPSSYSATNEASGTGWAAGGVLVSAAASGGASLSPATSVVGTEPTSTLKFTYGANLSVASTTVGPARGCRLYMDALVPKANVVAIWFGGTDYSTVAGTFAITWNASGVITVTLAA